MGPVLRMAPATLLLLCCLAFAGGTLGNDKLPICSLAATWAYPCEEHVVPTADGFLLSVARIPGTRAPAAPVILQHGLIDTAGTWLFNAPQQSLGYLLHDAGFDVWLPNSRGTVYSGRNTRLTPLDADFWRAIDFSRMAQYDVPAVVDYVLRQTRARSVAWVGHSQGTAQMFAALSENYGNVRSKLSVFVALAPVAYTAHITSALMIAMSEIELPHLLQLLGERDFMPNTAIYSALGHACVWMQEACDLVPLVICGGNFDNLNASRFGFYLRYDPGGTSVHNMAHWAQQIRSPAFGQFDWGPEGNLERYHRPQPPQYNLSNVRVPVALFSGGIDALAAPRDVATITAEVPSVVHFDIQQHYAHMDFVWGMDAHKRVYPDVVGLVRKYTEQSSGPVDA